MPPKKTIRRCQEKKMKNRKTSNSDINQIIGIDRLSGRRGRLKRWLLLVILVAAIVVAVVMRTKTGRAMRAVAEDKKTAALMGINVDRVIANTFAISGVLAGAAGVMWGLHMGIIYPFVGFLPGIKAFTAAVMGGIGSVPGAMLGGLSLGVLESVGPAVLGIDYQLKDVVAFAILVLVLVFRPSGLLGEVLAQKKA